MQKLNDQEYGLETLNVGLERTYSNFVDENIDG